MIDWAALGQTLLNLCGVVLLIISVLLIILLWLARVGRQKAPAPPKRLTAADLRAEARALDAEAARLAAQLPAIEGGSPEEVEAGRVALHHQVKAKRARAETKRTHAANLAFYEAHIDEVKALLQKIEKGFSAQSAGFVPVEEGAGPDAQGGTVEWRITIRLDRHGFTVMKDDYSKDEVLGADIDRLAGYIFRNVRP